MRNPRWLCRTISVGTGAVLAAMLSACGSAPPEATSSSGPVKSESESAISDLHALLPEEIKSSGVLKIGTPYGTPPSIFVDETGDPTGIAHDVAEKIGALLGVDIQWQELQFSGVIPGLQSGNFDLSLGVIGDTPERQELLDFVDLMANDSVLLTQAENPAGITDLEHACGKKIGILNGSLQITRVEEASSACADSGQGAIEILEYPGSSEAQAQVQSARIDAYFAPYLLQNYTAKTAGGGNIFELGTGFYPDNPWAIAMQKDRGSLSEAVQGALLELVDNGDYQQILEDYDSPQAALSSEKVMINGAGTAAFSE